EVASGPQPSFDEREAASSRQEAEKNDPRLMQTTTLEIKKATLPQALIAVVEQKDISFVAQEWQGDKPLRKTVLLANTPLAEAFAYLTDLYSFSWQEHRYHFVWSQRKKSGV